MALPVYHAPQGHPEPGKQWMNMIDNILINELGLKTATHDQCIYCCVVSEGKIQLMLQQVEIFY